MLNFAEQTGSGTVIVVWYYLIYKQISKYTYTSLDDIIITLPPSHIHRHIPTLIGFTDRKSVV